jgi:hypothetical protein
MNQVTQDSVFKDSLKDVNLSDFLTYSYCIIDDIFQEFKHYAIRKGPACSFSDSEIICLNLVCQMVCDFESSWHSFVTKNHLDLFPKLLERSRYHRRYKDLQAITELIRYKFITLMDYHLQDWHMDSMPVLVCVYVRASRNLRFATAAADR